MRTVLVIAVTVALAMAGFEAVAAEPEWVAIDEKEEGYVLAPEAPSVELNDRTYRYEVAGSKHYEDGQRLEFTIWSDAFVPDVYVREAMSPAGMVGAGTIVARSEYEKMVKQGRTYHVRRLIFQPSESGQYRLVVTSNYDITDWIRHDRPVTGAFNIAWTLYEWTVPEPEPEPEPEEAGLRCAIAGTDARPDNWSEGSYGLVFFRDNEDRRFSDRTYRFHGMENMSWEKVERFAPDIQRVYPNMTLIDIMTRSEACDRVSDECGSISRGDFAEYCGDLGMPSPLEY